MGWVVWRYDRDLPGVESVHFGLRDARRRIALAPGFDAETLRRVIEAIEVLSHSAQ